MVVEYSQIEKNIIDRDLYRGFDDNRFTAKFFKNNFFKIKFNCLIFFKI